MKKGLTKIVFVVDRSGSMSSIAKDMIGGFNQFIKTQKENKVGECRVTFNQFDDIFEEVYKNVEVNDVKDLTSDTFQPRGSTALLDAIGRTITNVGVELSALPEGERPERVLIVILTDGGENSSREYTNDKVKEMVKHQTEVYKWEFSYIGANQDSWTVGASYGFTGSSTLNYASYGVSASYSMHSVFDTLANKAVQYRSGVTGAMAFTPDEQKLQNDLIANNKP
jgi:hypothetical protein